MNVIKIVLGELEENCYIVEAPEKTALVIDPGAEAELVEGELESRGLSLRKILLTHGHFDHIGAAAQLKEHCGAQVYISAADEAMLKDREKSGAYMLPYAPFHPVEADARVKEGDIISQGSMRIKVIETPGHSAGSVCYVIDDCIFAGDTIFCGSVGRTDLYSGDFRAQQKTLERLAAMEKDYRLYCGHGEDTTLEAEKRHNPYLAMYLDRRQRNTGGNSNE